MTKSSPTEREGRRRARSLRRPDSTNPQGDPISERGVDPAPWTVRGVVALLVGGLWTFLLFNPLVFPVLDEGIGADTLAERTQAIDESFTQWRLAWLVNMAPRLLIGVGLWLFCRHLATREVGRRATVATTAAWVGLINAPLGIARFLITLDDADYAADPGLWFEVLWGAHLFGTIIAGFAIVWLTYGSIAPRWAAVALALFTAMSILFQAAPPAYTGMGIYAGAVLWRMRKLSRESAAPHPV